MILQTKDLGLAVQAIAASPPLISLQVEKKLNPDPENKGLRTGGPRNRGLAALDLREKNCTLILKIKDLAERDPQNKGLSKIDPENKGFSSQC